MFMLGPLPFNPIREFGESPVALYHLRLLNARISSPIAWPFEPEPCKA